MKKIILSILVVFSVLFLVHLYQDSQTSKFNPSMLSTLDELDEKHTYVSFNHLDGYLYNEDKVKLSEYFEHEKFLAIEETCYTIAYSSESATLSYVLNISINDDQEYQFQNENGENKEVFNVDDLEVNTYSSRIDGIHHLYTYMYKEMPIVIELNLGENITHTDLYNDKTIKEAISDMIRDSLVLTA